MDLADRVTTIKLLLRNRDSQFTTAFDAVFAADGIRILLSPPGTPRANAICEPMIATLRRELFDKILIVNQRHLRRILSVYLHQSQHRATTPHAQTTRPSSSRNRTPTSGQPRRLPASPQTNPRRAHLRVPPHRMSELRITTCRSNTKSYIRAPQDGVEVSCGRLFSPPQFTSGAG